MTLSGEGGCRGYEVGAGSSVDCYSGTFCNARTPGLKESNRGTAVDSLAKVEDIYINSIYTGIVEQKT